MHEREKGRSRGLKATLYCTCNGSCTSVHVKSAVWKGLGLRLTAQAEWVQMGCSCSGAERAPPSSIKYYCATSSRRIRPLGLLRETPSEEAPQWQDLAILIARGRKLKDMEAGNGVRVEEDVIAG